MKEAGKYEDIIHLPHHRSERHPHMSSYDRAAQFSPFAALKGYDEAIDEEGRLTDERAELDEERRAMLDETLRMLKERGRERPRVAVTFFRPDPVKSGGAYVEISGTWKCVDESARKLVLMEEEIPLDDVYDIKLL